MTVQGLLGRLHAAEILLRKSDGDLLISGKKENVDAALLQGLRIHKAALLDMIPDAGDGWWRPPQIRPEAFPLAELDQQALDAIVASVPGGASNVQDIYPLAPLQEGILFHHLMKTEGDTYLLEGLLRFDSRERVDAYVGALRAVIARHDILRTAIAWEGLREPVQVVWREAKLRVQEVELDADGGDAEAQLYARYHPRHYRIDLREAPIMRVFIARDEARGCWLLLLLRHHIVSDHTTMGVLRSEIEAHLAGRAHELPEPLPFRTFVAQARLGASRDEHAAFFTAMLGDVEEPTAPFGLLDLRGDWSEMLHARLEVEAGLGLRIRERARLLGVSAASICHLAWAQLLARVSGRGDVVFGTVLVGRMQGGEGTDRVMGPFINSLPVRIRVGGEGAEASVRRTHALLAELMRHEHASLALAQRCSRVQAPAPLFSALFNYRHSGRRGPGAEGMELRRSEDRTNYPFNLAVDDFGDRLRLMAEVQPPADAARVCALMHAALAGLVDALETAPERPIGAIDVLPEPERLRVVEEWNATAAPFPGQSCAHELFEAQVRRAPDAPAVVHAGGAVSYAELNARANRLAHHLRTLGVGPDAAVAIHVERGPEMVVGLLAVLKAGGAFVPLDPAYPADRLRYMLEDAAPVVVLTQESLAERLDSLLGGIVVPVVSLDAEPSSWTDEPETDLERAGLTPQHLAYVIYTSGSTGRPKGVMVSHHGVCNLIGVQSAVLLADRESRVLQFASFSFDGCIFEVVMALGHGGSLHLLPAGELPVGEALAQVVESQGVTHAIIPPPVLAALPPGTTLPSLRTLVAAGDALPPAVQARWSAGRRFINGYGPTEATVATTAHVCGAPGAESPPIGRPVPNMRVYVLDPAGRPAPVGAVGELYVGGVGLARGYLRRPSLTAERFVPNPFGGTAGARLYRTGDLGRWLPDGTLDFVGRNDAQVKVRGFRIELGEIEARLAEHAGVREAVVQVREDVPGSKRLVAYFVGDAELDAASLRAHLGERLPEYLVPAAYVRLDALPLSPNGKVDRHALPVPEDEAYAVQAFEAPVGETEAALAEVWAEVLGLERVGRHDNFFELGGHSLSAVTLIERMRRRGLHSDVRALFTKPTLADLAAEIGGESLEVVVPPNLIPPGCDAITPRMLPLVELDEAEIARIVAGVPGGAANVQDIYPLAPLQEGMLFHHLLATDRDPYVTRILSSFESRGQLDAYVGALQAVVGRHDILRTSIAWEGIREAVQVVWRQARLVVEEVELDPAAGDAEEQLYAHADPGHYRVDVRRAPMLRLCAAYDEGRGRWLLLELRHHLSGDHTTLAVLKAEVQAILAGRADQLRPPLPFRDYVAQARLGISREEHEAFFRDLLGDVDEPTAPFGMLDVQGDGGGIERGRLEVESGLAARLRERARALGVSAASICHVAWARVVARTSGRDDVVFGTLLFGRMGGGAGADRVMGLFINTLPVRVRAEAAGVEASVRAMHVQLAELLRHEHAPLALAQRCSGVQAPAPLFTSLLNYRHNEAARQARTSGQGRDGMRTLRSQERTNYPIVLAVDDLGDFLGLTAHAPASLGPDRVCALMHRALEGVVDALEAAPQRSLATIDALPEPERRTLVEAWNATDAAYPDDLCIHQLFEAQAERTPGATAVVFEDDALTYAELNARANRLAHHLRGLGVGPDTRVAVCVERGPRMVAGLLAVLKAGGAYVPLDPEYPEERLRYMLADSAPAVVLTQQSIQSRFDGMDLPLVILDAEPSAWAGEPETNPEPAGLTPEHLAYVIYTSGSTGRPKGVMNLHHNLVNRLSWGQGASPLGAGDAVLQATSLSFDVSAREIFWPLLAGARLVLANPRAQRDPAQLAEMIQARGITTLNLVPSLLQVLVDEPEMARCTGLTRVLCSGEALPAALLRQVRERLPWVQVTNIYGPSEAATAVAVTGCEAEEGTRTAAIGRPTGNARAYLLDGRGDVVPAGVAAELYVGGAGVARGYLNRPGMTAERFVPDPFGAPGSRLYRTGDLARWRADGTLDFLGRNDHQVKVRGFRIEAGEIEARLAEHPGVREAVVLAREDVPGDRRLVAYVVGEAPEAEALRAHLAARLPEYMVPAAYVRLDALPLTPNGKLDRAALPAPEDGAYGTRGYEAPADETEEELAAIWAEVLGVERVGRHDHFFELGGHSLLAVKVVSRVREVMEVDVALGELFERPVLSAFAQQVMDAQLAQFDPQEIARLAALLHETEVPHP